MKRIILIFYSQNMSFANNIHICICLSEILFATLWGKGVGKILKLMTIRGKSFKKSKISMTLYVYSPLRAGGGKHRFIRDVLYLINHKLYENQHLYSSWNFELHLNLQALCSHMILGIRTGIGQNQKSQSFK